MKNIEILCSIKSKQDKENYCLMVFDGKSTCADCEVLGICAENRKTIDFIAKIQQLPEVIIFNRKEKLEKLLDN